MVLPDSSGIPRVPPYSGTLCAMFHFAYEALTRYGQSFQTVLLCTYGSRIRALQPRLPVDKRFGLIRVRSPLLTESLLISVPSGTEMFHFPEFAPKCLCIQHMGDQTLLWPGCPIRKSPDQSLFDGSPRHIAAYHVLHRLLTPRHPPYALNILTLFTSPIYLSMNTSSQAWAWAYQGIYTR